MPRVAVDILPSKLRFRQQIQIGAFPLFLITF